MEKKTYDTTLDAIFDTYNNVVKVIDDEANDTAERAYGGVVRSVKGWLQEYITHSLVYIAWHELGGSNDRININKHRVKIPIKKDYILKIVNKEIRDYIIKNIFDYHYKLSVDKHVFIDGKFVMGIECKAYTENAMIKRILVDFGLLCSVYPNISCYLFQLESQLGGDYAELSDVVYGSHPTHTIMSYFDTTLTIVTLLQGERNVSKPIYKEFKPLIKKHLTQAKDLLKKDMQRYI